MTPDSGEHTEAGDETRGTGDDCADVARSGVRECAGATFGLSVRSRASRGVASGRLARLLLRATSAATAEFGAGGVIVVGVTVVGGAVVGGGGGVQAKLIVNPPENSPSGPRRTETVTVSASRVIVPGVVSMMASASRSTSKATTVLEPDVMIRSLFGCVD